MMKKWEIGAIIGAIWGLISLKTLSGGVWLDPLRLYSFGLPTALAFPIVHLSYDIFGLSASYVVLYLSAPGIGALIGAGIGYLIDKYKR